MVGRQTKRQKRVKEKKTRKAMRKCQCVGGCSREALPGGAMCRFHQMNGCQRVSPVSGAEPVYAPGLYNQNKIVKDNYNCFAYAFDIHDNVASKCVGKDTCTLSFHQPGAGSGFKKFKQMKKLQCPDLAARLKAEVAGLKVASFEEKCPVGTSKIALVTDSDADYHFYRQDRGGMWSHKPGGGAVTNRDAAGHQIYDPALADRNYARQKKGTLNYENFCTYLCTPRTPAATRRVRRS
jgi:hypothetical protein